MVYLVYLVCLVYLVYDASLSTQYLSLFFIHQAPRVLSSNYLSA
jgi:hypothetical protein